MEYTVKQLGDLAGISSRTLRYYDAIGLLKPTRLTESGYRLYGRDEVDRLQHLLFFREFGMPLKVIKELLDSPDTTSLDLLEQHHDALLEKRQHIDSLIQNVERTIASKRGDGMMTDQEKFEAFKAQQVKENGDKFGKEVQVKYGNEWFEKANQSFQGLTHDDYTSRDACEKELVELLSLETVSIPSAEAQKIYDLHKQWIVLSAGQDILQVYQGIVEMYLQDERFISYYDGKAKQGATQVLHDCVLYYLNE